MSEETDFSPAPDGKYEVVEKIKEGGFGAVYKVKHRELGVYHVIKVIRPKLKDNKELQERFKNEARVAAKLEHPNVVRIFDLRIEADECRIDMEFIDGFDLDHFTKPESLLPVALVLEISRQCLRALAYLHKEGIVHCDVSPDNFILDFDTEGRPRVRLIDLGFAHHPVLGEDTSGIFGKPGYASPEHFDNPPKVERRSDIYAFGVVLYELLTGKHPHFEEGTLRDFRRVHRESAPMSFAITDPRRRVPENLQQIVLKALAKRVEERFASADLFGKEIERLQSMFLLTAGDLSKVRKRLNEPKPESAAHEKDKTATLHKAAPPKPVFVAGPAIERDEDFFGRSAQRAHLREALRSGRSVQLLGERRMGKTSLLKWAHRHASEYQERPTAFVDAQGLAGSSPEALVLEVAEELGHRVEAERLFDHAGRTPTGAGEVLQSFLPLVLLVDEAAKLALEGHGFDEDFLGLLRAFGQEGKLVWISASHHDLRKLFADSGLNSSFLNDSRMVWVGQLEDSAAQEIVEQLNDEVSSELILAQAGGFAYGIQWLADALWHDNSDRETTCDLFFEEMRPNFERWWDLRTDEERDILKWCLPGLAKAGLTSSRRRKARTLEWLGLVVEQDGQFVLPGDAWREFVQNAP